MSKIKTRRKLRLQDSGNDVSPIFETNESQSHSRNIDNTIGDNSPGIKSQKNQVKFKIMRIGSEMPVDEFDDFLQKPFYIDLQNSPTLRPKDKQKDVYLDQNRA